MRWTGLLLVAVGFCVTGAAQAGSASLTGSWAGEMRQVDVDRESRYPMVLSLKGSKGTTAYPTLKCTGVLSRVAETKGGYAIYQEKVKNDPGGSCIDGLVTVTTTDGGKVILGWFAAFEGAPSLASAVLDKDAKQ